MRTLLLVHGKAIVNNETVTKAQLEVSDDEALDMLKTGAWKDITDEVKLAEAKKAPKAKKDTEV